MLLLWVHRFGFVGFVVCVEFQINKARVLHHARVPRTGPMRCLVLPISWPITREKKTLS